MRRWRPPLPAERRTAYQLLAILAILVGLGCVAGFVARSFATPTDLNAVRDLGSIRSTAWTGVLRGVSWLGTAAVVAPLALLAWGWLVSRGRRQAAMAVVLCAIGATVISSLVKVAVDRPRPPVHHLVAVSSASFPSGHATESSAFYLALLIALCSPRLARPLKVLLAALVICIVLAIGFSRLYLGVHYPTDVGGGLLLGSAWTASVMTRLRLVPSRLQRRRGATHAG